MRIFRTSISFLFLLFPLVCKGTGFLSKIPEAELFTIESGMSQTRSNVVFSDSYGFLWVGTSNGLNRYDGYSFSVFKHVPYDSASLSQNFITSISEDEFTNLWVGTNHGLNCYDRKTGKFTQFIHVADDSATISDYQILSVYADKKGSVWIKTENSLDRLNINTKSITHFPFNLKNFNSNGLGRECQIIEDKKGFLWFGTGDGLFSFNTRNGEYFRYANSPDDPASLSNNEVLSVFEDKNNNLWVGTRNGLNKFDSSQNRFSKYHYSPGELPDESLTSFFSIIQDSNGTLWLTSNRGIELFDPENSSVKLISSLYINKVLINIGSIAGMQIDKSGIIWIAGFQGLFKIDTKPKKFNLYNSSANAYPSLSGDMVSCIYKETDDLIWVGTWGQGLNILNRRTGENIRYNELHPDRSKRISSNMVRCIYRDHSGNLWIGTVNGIDIFDPSTRTFKSFEKALPEVESGALKNHRVICILEDRKGDMWIATDKGVLRFQKKLKLITSYNKIYRDNVRAEMGIVYSMAVDNENKIWIGTENGLNCYDSAKDIFYRYIETGKKNDLSSRLIYYLFFDSRNTLWVGTASGLNRFIPDKGKFIAFTESDGLSNDFINAILEDDNYCLWLSTNKGISRYDILRNEFTNFELNEGLQSYEFNHAAAFKAPDGEMFFGGIAGFNSFFPQNLPVNPNIPQIVITSIEIADKNGVYQMFPGSASENLRVTNYQSFKVSYAALDFTLPESNHFEYSIEPRGKPDVWVSVDNQNAVTFSNLSPGTYILRIRGSNSDRVWNQEGTMITVVSVAPVWKSRLAIYLYFIFGGLFIYLSVQYRTQALRKSNRVLRERDIASREISRQKDLLSLRNKNIEDSLNYAQRIQKAMLTTPRQFRTILPNSFIFHKPKDIVSGDFYWVSEQSDRIFVAAADCTGHGVPGAFMSLISFELFRKIIKTQKIYSPAAILNSMNDNFEEIFGNVEDIIIKDGMDLSFCVFNKAMTKLEFSGAFNPLYLVRDNNLIELKADHFSIGADIGSDAPPKIFSNHSVDLMPGDMIYMFSDGYADQFGGPEGKKYKYRRFRHLLLTIHKSPLDKQRAIIEESIEEWRGNAEQVDDILVIGIRTPGGTE